MGLAKRGRRPCHEQRSSPRHGWAGPAARLFLSDTTQPCAATQVQLAALGLSPEQLAAEAEAAQGLAAPLSASAAPQAGKAKTGIRRLLTSLAGGKGGATLRARAHIPLLPSARARALARCTG